MQQPAYGMNNPMYGVTGMQQPDPSAMPNTDEMQRILALAAQQGMSEDQIAQLQNRMRLAQARAEGMPRPEGMNSTGRVYTASHPGEHLVYALRQRKLQKQQDELQRKMGDAYTQLGVDRGNMSLGLGRLGTPPQQPSPMVGRDRLRQAMFRRGNRA